MEITIEDFKHLKLSPSLIVLLKTLISKDDKYLQELNKVANIFAMANHLQEKMIIKIVGKDIKCNSFEIRKLDIIKYLNNESNSQKLERQIDEILLYFKEITGKSRVSIISSSNRKFVKARLREYTIKDLKDVIDLKYSQWKDNNNMRSYIRISTFFNEEKFQGYVGELDNEDKTFTDEDLNTERA